MYINILIIIQTKLFEPLSEGAFLFLNVRKKRGYDIFCKQVKWLISDTKFTCATEQFSNQDLLLSTQTYLCMPTKIQQTKMLVTCQRFGDLFLFGLVGLVGLFIINLHIKVLLCAKKKLPLNKEDTGKWSVIYIL